jgi:hypothetical protein
MDGLEMLGFTGCGRDGHTLLTNESIDGTGFTDVGVTNKTNADLCLFTIFVYL